MGHVYYQCAEASRDADLPVLPGSPYKLILIVREACAAARRVDLAECIVASGCRYLMAWGDDCRAWQDAVNLASLRQHDFGAIPDADIVITTAHPKETLNDTFWFARYTAMHPCHSLDDAVLLQIGGTDSEEELQARFAAV